MGFAAESRCNVSGYDVNCSSELGFAPPRRPGRFGSRRLTVGGVGGSGLSGSVAAGGWRGGSSQTARAA